MMLLLQAAAAVATDPALSVTNPDIHNLIDAVADQAGLVFVSVYAIQFVKKSQLFPFVNANSTQVTKWISVATALFSALAIQIHIQGSSAAGWHGTFAIPNAHDLWTSFVRFCGAKMGQDVLYNTVYNKPVEVVPVRPVAMDAGGKPVPKEEPAPLVSGEGH